VSGTIQNLNERITSFAVLDSATHFVIAYYIDDGSGLLSPPLLVGRYNKKEQGWKTTALRNVGAPFLGTEVNCLGSVTAIRQMPGFIFIDTHLNPSAGCLVVFSDDLAVRKALSGWYLAAFRSGLLVFHRSQIHFAPTHPMEIAVYNLQSDAQTQIYPPLQDPIRAEYVERLRSLMPGEDWCREHNTSCDPRQFSNEIWGAVAVNEEAGAMAFVARFDPGGLVPKEVQERTPDLTQDVAYVFLFSPHAVRHRQFRFSEIRERFGAAAQDDLVKPAVLDRLFAQTSPRPER